MAAPAPWAQALDALGCRAAAFPAPLLPPSPLSYCYHRHLAASQGSLGSEGRDGKDRPGRGRAVLVHSLRASRAAPAPSEKTGGHCGPVGAAVASREPRRQNTNFFTTCNPVRVLGASPGIPGGAPSLGTVSLGRQIRHTLPEQGGGEGPPVTASGRRPPPAGGRWDPNPCPRVCPCPCVRSVGTWGAFHAAGAPGRMPRSGRARL